MKTIFIALLLVFSANLYSQFYWTNPNPSPYVLNDIDFVSSSVGWAVGNNGTLIKTTDGGETWVPVSVPVRSPFNKVKFYNEDFGFILGGNPLEGALLITTDGGKHWSDNNPLNDYGWFDISIINENIIYISGFDGIYKSTDGGINWVKKGGTGWAVSIYFLDSLTGFFGNTVGGIYKTTNGGNDWTQVADKKWMWHNSIKFLDDTTGFITSSGLYTQTGCIYKTTDGGETWVLKDSLNAYEFCSIDIIDQSQITAVGSRGIVVNSTDGGETWSYSYIQCNDNFKSISHEYGKTWIVGGNNYGRMFAGIGGVFSEKSKAATTSILNSIDFYDKSNVSAVGYDGAFIITSDGGNSWKNVNTFASDFSSVCYLNENFIAAAGADGVFIKSTNGGISWSISYPFSTWSSNIINFVTEDVGFVVSWNSRLSKTTNGGTDWFEINSGGIYDFFCTDALNGWALTLSLTSNNTVMEKTTDGGQTWTVTYFDKHIDDIFFVNDRVGWYSSENNLFKSYDGGITWEPVSQNLNFSIHQIIFTDENRGYFFN